MAPTSRGSPRLRAGVIASTACRNSSGRLPRCIGEHQPRREAVRFNPCLAVLASDVPGEGSDRRLRCLLRWAAVVFQRAGDADAPPRTTLRLGTGKQSSGRTGPASSKPQPMSELRNHPRKLTPNSATFTRTGQSSPFVSSKRRLRRMPTACWLCNLVWTIPVEIVQIYIAISVAWGPSGGEVVRELTNRSPGLTPSGRVDAVRGGSSFVAAHWGDEAPDAVGDGCSGNFGLR